jgi:hypothetical protein
VAGKPMTLSLQSVNLNVMPGLLDDEDQFLDARRRGLGRFLELIARHPVLSEDEDVRQFYSEADEVRRSWRSWRSWPMNKTEGGR